jgi:hypothetical protein
MFRAAQFIVRHKIGVVAIAAIAFMVFGRSGNEHKAASPWDTDSVQQAAADANTSLADKALGAAAGAAKQYAGVDVEKVLPGTLKKQTVDNWQSAEDAARRANGN